MRRERVPDLTHLQFLVLGVLHGGEQPGCVVRDALAQYGVRRTAAAFYQLMSRLERDRLVDGHYRSVVVGDQGFTERCYAITPAGAKLWNETRAFYESVGLVGQGAVLRPAASPHNDISKPSGVGTKPLARRTLRVRRARTSG